MAGKFRRSGKGQAPASVICNNCLENHFMSICPKPLSTCASCGEPHNTKRCEAVKEQKQKRKERDDAHAKRSAELAASRPRPEPGSPAAMNAVREKSRQPQAKKSYMAEANGEDLELAAYDDMRAFLSGLNDDKEREELAFRATLREREFDICEGEVILTSWRMRASWREVRCA